MVKVVRKRRKPPILTPSSIPCLKNLPTVNITQGCALGCTYCYIKSYRSYPGSESVILFENTAEVLGEELTRKRHRPARVYFSPSSDAFQYLPEIQDVTFVTMELLLERRIEVAFLTKGFITQRFLSLFERHADHVHAQVGITSLSRDLWRAFEPRTSTPVQRIQTARNLHRSGIEVTARLDPLIPDLTDTTENLRPLLAELHDAGVSFAAASYIFLRSGFSQQLSDQLSQFGVDSGTWPTQTFLDGCGRGQMLSIEERRRRFAVLTQLGREHSITVTPCKCKNPSLVEGTCRIAGSGPFEASPVDDQRVLPFHFP